MVNCTFFSQVDQSPGDFMFLWPRVFHGGFNHGLNLAEARNIFTPDVINYNKYPKRCTCGYDICFFFFVFIIFTDNFNSPNSGRLRIQMDLVPFYGLENEASVYSRFVYFVCLTCLMLIQFVNFIFVQISRIWCL